MKILFLTLFLAAIMIFRGCSARAFEARNEDRLFRGIERSELAVVLFYRESRALRKEDYQQAQHMSRLVHIFNRASSNILFEEGGLIFIRANCERHDLDRVAESFGVRDVPTMVIFSEGQLLKNGQGNPIILTGFFSQDRLISCINQHLRPQLEKNRKQYLRRQEVRALSGPRVSFGVGVGFPGCGYGCGYYDPYDYEPYQYYDRPCWGVGFGIGGTCW